MPTKLKVVQPVIPEEEVPTEILADHILAISEGVKRLRSGRLNNKALVLLIQHATPTVDGKRMSATEIRAVLDGIEDLAKTYLK